MHRQPEAVEIEVDDGCGVEGQYLADEQSADDRDAERLAQFGTLAKADRQRHRSKHRRHRRHYDRPKAFEAGLVDRFTRCQAVAALSIEREIDHHDRVLFDDANQQDNADHCHDAELGAGVDQRQHRADPCRRQGRQNRERVDEALIEHPQHDIDGEQCRSDQNRLSTERLLKHPRRPLKAAADRGRHAKLAHLILDRRRGLAERDVRREVERHRRRDEEVLVVDGKRRVAWPEMGNGGKRHHRLSRNANRGTGRSRCAAGVGERVVG